MRLTGRAGAASAAPAPPLSPEDAAFDLTPIARALWDLAAVYGPAPGPTLFAHFPATAINYREFVRFHPEFSGNTSAMVTRRADRWMFDQTVERCVRNGWLIEADGQLAAHDVPPQHKPLATIGGENRLRNILLDAANKLALEVLAGNGQAVRKKASAAGRRRLIQSIEVVGQLEPIVVWSPPRITGLPDIIVDGVVRQEVLIGLGIEPKARPIGTGRGNDRELTAAEVLLMRIESDEVNTAKTITRGEHEEYLAQLTKAGVRKAELIDAIRGADQRIAELHRMVPPEGARAKPTNVEVDRIVALCRAGWEIRDIATETGWSMAVVEANIKTADSGTDQLERDPLPREGTKARRMLDALASIGSATLREACEAAGLDRRDISNQSLEKLLEDGLIQPVGRKGRAEVFRATKKLLQYVPSRSTHVPESILRSDEKSGREDETIAAILAILEESGLQLADLLPALDSANMRRSGFGV
jgi:hypothetical protein